MIPPPEPSPDLVAFDEPTRDRLRKLPHAKGFHLELEFPVHLDMELAEVNLVRQSLEQRFNRDR